MTLRKTRITVTIELVVEVDLDIDDDAEGLSLVEEEEIRREASAVARDFSWRGQSARESPFVDIEVDG